MPLYEYCCPRHGAFEQFGKASDYMKATTCPTCQASSPRQVSMPRVRAASALQVQAGDRNEKSRHEPHVCHSGCGHRHRAKAPKPSQATNGKSAFQAYSGPRPWVVEHAM